MQVKNGVTKRGSSRTPSVLFLLALVAVATPTVLWAQPDPRPERSLRHADPQEETAQRYAAEHAVSVETAHGRFQAQELAGELEADLRAREEANFAGVWIEHTPTFRVVVSLVGKGKSEVASDAADDQRADAALVPYLRDSSLRPFVEVRRAKVSLARLETAQELAMAVSRDLGIDVSSGINLAANRVEIYVLDKARFIRALASAGTSLPDDVVIEEVKEVFQQEAAIYGGLPLTKCTSGWSVKDSSGIKGIVTAGHCPDTQYYNSKKLTLKKQIVSGKCDVQWHVTASAGYTPEPKFATASNDCCPRKLTGIKSRSSQAVGNWVCKFGKTTGYTCGYIIDKSFNPGVSDHNSSTYIRVRKAGVNLSEDGDSGGPWFNGYTGYGIHTAGIGDDAVYMGINYISDCLSLTVLISP